MVYISGVPGANEVLGCPDDLFSFSHLAKLLVIINFLRKLRPWMPPGWMMPRWRPFSLTFWSFTYLFKRKLGRWMTPRLDARGRRTVRTPFCTPPVYMYELQRNRLASKCGSCKTLGKRNRVSGVNLVWNLGVMDAGPKQFRFFQ